MTAHHETPVGVPTRFGQLKAISPRKVWIFGALQSILFCGLLVFSHTRGIEPRFPLLVSLALTIGAIGGGVWLFLRFQIRTLDLMHSAQLKSRVIGACIRNAIALPLALFVLSLQGGMTPANQLHAFTTLTMVTLGMSVIAVGMMRRLGDEQFCTTCGYECRVSSERCAECGAFWLEPRGLIRGRRVGQRGIIVFGIAIILVGSVGSISPQYNIFRAGLFAMPDAVRIRAATSGAPWSSQWRLQDLLAKKLSSENQDLLAVSLLDQRIEEGRLSAPANAWLEKRVLTSGCSPDIRERFFDDMLELWLEGPDHVGLDESFVPLIASRNRVPVSRATLTMQIYFAGVSTDGGSSFQGKSNHVMGPSSTANVWYYRESRTFSKTNSFIPTVSFDTPGDQVLAVRMWLAVVPMAIQSFKATWREDGTPELPPAAVWTKEINLRRTVIVK